MAYLINIKEGGHTWNKVNMVTITTKKSCYDILKCSVCGIQGKTTSLTTIRLKGSYSKDKIYNCSGNHNARKIQITTCRAVGKPFGNLTPGSIHEVVLPPDEYKNDKGTWVMGVGEPVKVLPDEFIILTRES